IEFRWPTVVFRQHPKGWPQSFALGQFGAHFKISVSLRKRRLRADETRNVGIALDACPYAYRRRLRGNLQHAFVDRERIEFTHGTIDVLLDLVLDHVAAQIAAELRPVTQRRLPDPIAPRPGP